MSRYDTWLQDTPDTERALRGAILAFHYTDADGRWWWIEAVFDSSGAADSICANDDEGNHQDVMHEWPTREIERVLDECAWEARHGR